MPIDYRFIIVTLCFMGFDIVTGIIKAASIHDIQSEKLRVGLWHKLGFICAIFGAYLVEYTLTITNAATIGIEPKIPLMEAVCGYIIFTEIVSSIENIIVISPELKDKLKFLFGVPTDKQ